MNKPILSLFLILTIVFGTTKALQNTYVCPSTELKNSVKEQLKPDYKYDSSKTTRVNLTGGQTSVEVEVPLFIGEKYKFLFNTSELPKDVVISVYNKKLGKNNRELLYTNKDEMKSNKTVYAWEPDKSRTMYINYEAPEGSKAAQGCVVFLLGYRI